MRPFISSFRHAVPKMSPNRLYGATAPVPAPSFLQSHILTVALTIGLALLVYFRTDAATRTGGPHKADATAGPATPTTTSTADIDVCSEEGIEVLTAALRSNPEEFGLRPYWAGRRKGMKDKLPPASSPIYPGLDDNLLDQSFRGKQVYFFGDSTLYYLDQWVYRLLASTNRTLVASSLSSMDMTAAHEAVDSAAPDISFNKITYRDSETYVSGTFTVGAVGPGGTCDLDEKYAKMKAKCVKVPGGRCQTVIANFGFHWLHFQGAGRTLSGCEALQWIQYEEWMQQMVQLAISVGANTLVFKTLNFICSEKYTDEYAEANAQYMAKGSALLDKCFHDLRNEIVAGDIDVVDADIRNYCYNGTFNERGSEYLNRRIEAFVQDHQGRQRGEKLGIKLGMYNDHDVESCTYTLLSDGRHYHPLNLVRIRLLGHKLWCMGGNGRRVTTTARYTF